MKSISTSAPQKGWGDPINCTGRMTLADSVLTFAQHRVNDGLLDRGIEVGPDLAKAHYEGPVALLNTLRNLKELSPRDQVFFQTRLQSGDEPALQNGGTMIGKQDGAADCVMEPISININPKIRHPAPCPSEAHTRIAAFFKAFRNVRQPYQTAHPFGAFPW